MNAEEASKLLEARKAGLDEIRRSLGALRKSIADFSTEAVDGLPAGVIGLVEVTVDENGVVDGVEIDERLRPMVSEAELLSAFELAFAGIPLPQAVVQHFVSDPAALRKLRDERAASAAVVFESDRFPIALSAASARPTRVSVTRAGGLLGLSSAEIADEVLQLARRAAASTGGKR